MSVDSLIAIPPIAPLKDKLEVSVSKHVSTPREAHGAPPTSVEAKAFVEDLAKLMTVVMLSNVSYEEILNFSRLLVEALNLRVGALLSISDPGQTNNNKALQPALQSVFTFADDIWAEAPTAMKNIDLPSCKEQMDRRQFAYAMRDVFLRVVDANEALGNQLSQNLGHAAREIFGSLTSLLAKNKGLDRDLQPLKDFVSGPSEKAAETKKSNEKVREEGYAEGLEVGRAQALAQMEEAQTPNDAGASTKAKGKAPAKAQDPTDKVPGKKGRFDRNK